jgi:hypothetical protein
MLMLGALSLMYGRRERLANWAPRSPLYAAAELLTLVIITACGSDGPKGRPQGPYRELADPLRINDIRAATMTAADTS